MTATGPASNSNSRRYRMTLAYRGSRYHGWQQQGVPQTYKGTPLENGGIPTVQELVRRALIEVVRHPIALAGSSRTDAGVHAKGQVAHFDTVRTQIPLEGMIRALNARLPDDIVVRGIEPVDDTFDAVRSTISKRYQYLIWSAPQRNCFISDLCWHRWQPLDVAAMRAAAALLVGEHDFASFAKPGHGRETTIRTVLGCDVAARGSRVVIGVEGTGFLWNMVRIIVGTLVEIGHGRDSPQRIREILAARDRRQAGPTAPPQGLYLQWIRFAP